MNSLEQYLSLYRDHRTLLDENSAPALNALRPEALKHLEQKGLPCLGSENYTYTDLNALLAPDYGLNLARVNMDMNPAAAFHCAVPGMASALFMLMGDRWAETSRSREDLPEGVTIGSLRHIAKERPELVEPWYGKIADLDNPIVALNTLLAQDGMLLHVARGVRVEKPIQLVSLLQGAVPLMAVRRLLIVVEEGASVRLLCCDHTQAEETPMMSLQTVEIYAGRGATVDIYDMEESGAKATRLSSLWLRQEADSNVLVDGITLYNGTTRNEYTCTFAGEHAELNLLGMAIEDGRRHADTYSLVRHEKGHCHTNELFKYVVDDHALGAFSGLIYVAPGAVKTEAYQSNRNLVVTDTAVMHTKPQLEIYNDDVKCSHGAAIGQLDETQLFYMRTRGLDEAEALLLLRQAFMADVIDGVRLATLRDRLHTLVEQRFTGADARCSSCTICK